MVGRVALSAALLVVLIGAADAHTRDLVGYEEGARKTVRCKGGGYFTGLEMSFISLTGFTEKVTIGLRLRCSTGALDVEYTGEVPDNYIFGANFAQGTVLRAMCPEGKGIAGFHWRRGEIQGREDQAWKPGGLEVFCGTETLNPIVTDLAKDKAYSLTDVQCSRALSPPPATEERRVVEFEVWEEVDWVGLRIVNCESAVAKT